MGELAMWQQRVEGFVLDQVGLPPARVLEVGCGEGELAHALARTGHSVTAIDP
jgi:2-polyprenyl-3-methyl-5-hydroxy-6-metoxy-1,4-benzoquinol methylase